MGRTRHAVLPMSDSYAFLPGGPFGAEQYNGEVVDLISVISHAGEGVVQDTPSTFPDCATHKFVLRISCYAPPV